jgi:hypothetical protein
VCLLYTPVISEQHLSVTIYSKVMIIVIFLRVIVVVMVACLNHQSDCPDDGGSVNL